eukprot:SAG31_NODE_2050_length_6560_cov_2.712119_3_plen_53_part_00
MFCLFFDFCSGLVSVCIRSHLARFPGVDSRWQWYVSELAGPPESLFPSGVTF